MTDAIEFYAKYLETALLQKGKKLAGFLLPGRKDYRRFVILSAPRTGSTLLHTYLNSSPFIYSLGEKPWRDLESGIQRTYFKDYPSFIRAVGFKVFYQFAIDGPYQSLYSTLVNDPEIHVIFLRRENTLEQYVSEQIARQRKAWTTSGNHLPPSPIKLDIETFEAYTTHQKALENQCLKDFRNHKMITTSYEAMVSDSQGVLDDLQEFLGVRKWKLYTVLEKQRTASLNEVLDNVEEIRSKYPEFLK